MAQAPRRFSRTGLKESGRAQKARRFRYDLNYKGLDLRQRPELYRVGVGEQGVLLVEPYKSEILRYWKFRTPALAKESSRQIFRLFQAYRRREDFVGMDMARKFLQMGFTRARRYANHASGRKYSSSGALLTLDEDPEKAAAAEIFFQAWKRAEREPDYQVLRTLWREAFG